MACYCRSNSLYPSDDRRASEASSAHPPQEDGLFVCEEWLWTRIHPTIKSSKTIGFGSQTDKGARIDDRCRDQQFD